MRCGLIIVFELTHLSGIRLLFALVYGTGMTHHPPLITTIIPTYRRPQMLKRALNSVLKQTYPHFKVCVYDNASGDETEETVRKICASDTRVHYHCHDENIGAYKNFQHGLMQIDTEYFSILSDDDFLLPEFFEIAMNGFERYPSAAFSAGSTITMTDQGKILYEPLSLWEKEGLVTPPEGVLETIGDKYPIWTGIVFRNSVLEFTGGLDPELSVGDLYFVSKIATTYPYVISKKVSAVCVNHSESSSDIAKLSVYWPCWALMIEKLTNDDSLPIELKTRIRSKLYQQIRNILFWIGIRCIEARDFEQARSASKILRDELNVPDKSKQLEYLLLLEKNQFLWQLAVLFLKFRRKIVAATNTERKKLQKKYGYLASRLENS